VREESHDDRALLGLRSSLHRAPGDVASSVQANDALPRFHCDEDAMTTPIDGYTEATITPAKTVRARLVPVPAAPTVRP
jgi:hypothetical protein